MRRLSKHSLFAAFLALAIQVVIAPLSAFTAEPVQPTAGYLARAKEWSFLSFSGKRSSIQMQELVRQSLWLAGREQFNLPIADAWLEEPQLIGQATITLHGTTSNDNAVGFTTDNADVPSTEITGLFDAKSKLGYRYTVVMAEYASRNEIEKTLESLGFAKRAERSRSDDPLPKEIEKQLGEVDLISQFLAVRELHALLSEQQSEAAIGGLVRGYANLGILTEFCLHPAHDVFKARSLLYAQRLCTLTGKGSPVGYWHRAYASALA